MSPPWLISPKEGLRAKVGCFFPMAPKNPKPLQLLALVSLRKPGICHCHAKCHFLATGLSFPGWIRPWAEQLVGAAAAIPESSLDSPCSSIFRRQSRSHRDAAPSYWPPLQSCSSGQPPSLLWPLLSSYFSLLLCFCPPHGAGVSVGWASHEAVGSLGNVGKLSLGKK